VYLPEWNQRFRREPASSADAHRSVRKDQDLASILSFVEDRVVANDYTISWLGQHYQIPLEQTKPRMRKAKLRVEQRLTGELVACWQGRQIALTPCVRKTKAAAVMPAADPPPQRRKAEPNGRWMKSFWVGDPAKRLPPRNIAPVSPTGSTP
jgi:hypothetical protein